MMTSIFFILLALLSSLIVVKAAPIANSFVVEWCDTFNTNCNRAAAAACGTGAIVIQNCTPVFIGNVCQAIDSIISDCAEAGGAFVPLALATLKTTVA
ncbi:hypothetical protein BG000_000954, partial [Podila horticola]